MNSCPQPEKNKMCTAEAQQLMCLIKSLELRVEALEKGLAEYHRGVVEAINKAIDKMIYCFENGNGHKE